MTLAARFAVGLIAVVSVAPFPARADARPADAPVPHGQAAGELTDDIAREREEAARIADEVESLSTAASIVLEEYRQGQALLEQADAALFESRRRLEALRSEYDATRELADDRITAMYRGENAPSPLSLLDANDAQDLGSRQHYAAVVSDRDRTAIEQLRVRRDDLAEEERGVARQREGVAAQTRALGEQQAAVESAMAERQQALEDSQGELAALVADEQARRQAEEQARAQARQQEADRRRAEEEARRRATPTTSATLPLPVAPPTSVATPVPPSAPSSTGPSTGPPSLAPEETGAPPPPVHPRAGEAVQAAMDKIGTPYRWGANGPDAYDCSGLTSYAWGAVGVRLPRSSGMQKAALPSVPQSALAPGDLVFFGSPVHHVGMYIGDGQMVNAPYTGESVRVNSIYRRDYAGAGRPG